MPILPTERLLETLEVGERPPQEEEQPGDSERLVKVNGRFVVTVQGDLVPGPVKDHVKVLRDWCSEYCDRNWDNSDYTFSFLASYDAAKFRDSWLSRPKGRPVGYTPITEHKIDR